MKNIKKARINVTLKQLFKYWLQLTSSFHKLTPGQQNVLALFLYYHFLYKKDITNERVLWKAVFDYDTKLKIIEELSIKRAVLHNNLSIFRKKGIIQNNKIVSTYIPDLSNDSNSFVVMFDLNIVDEKR